MIDLNEIDWGAQVEVNKDSAGVLQVPITHWN